MNLSLLYKTYNESFPNSKEFCRVWGTKKIPDFVGHYFKISGITKSDLNTCYYNLKSKFNFKEINEDVHDFFLDISLASMKELKLISDSFKRPPQFRFIEDRHTVKRSINIQKMKENNNDLKHPVQKSIYFTLNKQLFVDEHTSYIKYIITVKEEGKKLNIFTISYYQVNERLHYSIVGGWPSSIVANIKTDIEYKDSSVLISNKQEAYNRIAHALYGWFYEGIVKNFYSEVADGKVKIVPVTILSYINFFILFQSCGCPMDFMKFISEHMTEKQFLERLFEDKAYLSEVKELINIYEMSRI